jgi:murein DD-endopeptidase MepM/ murein hydrolase activator NlpD
MLNRRFSILALFRISIPILSCLALYLLPGTAEESSPPLRIALQSRSLQPGEVVLLTVRSDKPLRSMVANVLGRSYLFFAADGALVWKSLVGIDLGDKAGRYTVHIEGTRADGSTIRGEAALIVRPKNFPTRHLTVDEKFATPPKEEEERIQAEARRVQSIFASANPQRLWDGPFIIPVPGRPVSNFGKRSIVNGKPRNPHSGTDFSGAVGTPIASPNAGRVVLAANLYFSGNTVILDHGLGLYSYLAHLSEMEVRGGESIVKGDLVGKVGATGRVTGPHLHWSVRLSGSRVDPLSLISVLK